MNGTVKAWQVCIHNGIHGAFSCLRRVPQSDRDVRHHSNLDFDIELLPSFSSSFIQGPAPFITIPFL